MPWWDAVLLGAVEGLTEFLPVSSTGHLAILKKLLGYSIDSPDIYRIVTAWVRGVVRTAHREDPDYRFGWAVILGSLPIGIVGLLFKDQIETTLRNLWVVGSALVLWSAVMWFADRSGATLSAGLLRDIDRVTVTRLSFFLSIPALHGLHRLPAGARLGRAAPRRHGTGGGHVIP